MPSKEQIVNGCHHVAIRVKDFERTVRFYKEGLRLKERIAWGEGDKRAIMLDTGNDTCIEVFAGGKEAPAEGTILHVALDTNDCDALLQRAVEAGATLISPATTVKIPAHTGPVPVRIAFVRAPGGEVIEFIQKM